MTDTNCKPVDQLADVRERMPVLWFTELHRRSNLPHLLIADGVEAHHGGYARGVEQLYRAGAKLDAP